MIKNYNKILIFFCIVLAFVLRFYKLGINPPSLSWDEASLGYNAYSILKTGRDEYGTFLPFSIRSFNDFKPPFYSYLSIVPILIFGLNEFSTRFISATFGVLAVFGVYLLVKEISDQGEMHVDNRWNEALAILASLFLAISPWHLQFSRGAYEANLGLTLFIFGNIFLLRGIKKGQKLLIASLFYGFSLYAYHSLRLLIPVFLLGIIIIYRKNFWEQKKWLARFCSILLVFVLPLIINFSKEGLASRFSSVTILTASGTLDKSIKQVEYDTQQNDIFGKIIHNRRIVYALGFVKGYIDHYNFDFLFLTGDPPGRHHANNFGLLYLSEFPLILIGIYSIFSKGVKKNFFLIWWFLVAPVASALATGTPHAIRALYFIPIYQIISAYGFLVLYNFFKTETRPILAIYGLILILNFGYYLDVYYIHTPIEVSQWWQYGYKQLFTKISEIEGKYGKVVVTYAYDQPYIFYLFYNKVDPYWYQKNWGEGELQRSFRSFGKYEFRSIDWEKDKDLKRTLLAGIPGEFPGDVVDVGKITFLDGSTAFRLVPTK